MENGAVDFLVIGGGIAGAAVGAWLARRGRTLVLDRESQPGYHATGRSAALYSEHYGNPAVRALTRASGRFFRSPPEGFAEHPILSPRGVLFIARTDQMDALAATEAEMRRDGASPQALTWPEARARVPILSADYGAGALFDPSAMDIDAHGLLQGYLRELRGTGGRLVCEAEVTALERSRGIWTAITPRGRFAAPIVVNAAGAWADGLAGLAGLPPLAIAPLRRSIAIVEAPAEAAISSWPMVNDVDETFYMKPQAGRLLLSPGDETPCEPCDAQPEELDLAIAVDRLERATTLKVRRLLQRWAGLRSFAPDRWPVAGFDPLAEGFFWLAGQGGYGIQTSAALGTLAAALASGEQPPAELAREGVDAQALSPARLR